MNRGDSVEAERIHREVLEARGRVLGPDHPYTLRSMSQLATTLVLIRNFDEAELIISEAVDRYERTLGTDHVETLSAVRVLFQVTMGQRDHVRSLQIAERLLQQSIDVHGLEHEGTLGDMTNLGALYMRMGNTSRAIELFERSRPIKLRVLGEGHEFSKIVTAQLVMAYRMAGRMDDSFALEAEFIEMQLSAVDAMPIPQVVSLNSAAWMLLTHPNPRLRDAERGLIYAKRAFDLDMEDGTADNAAAIDTYARALHDTGDLDGAIEYQLMALSAAGDDERLRPGILRTLETYRAEKAAQESTDP